MSNYERLTELKSKDVMKMTMAELEEMQALKEDLLIPVVITTTQEEDGEPPEVWRLDDQADANRFVEYIKDNVDDGAEVTFKFKQITPKEWGEIEYAGKDLA